MPETEPKNIVYLFGAGATHAELQNLDPDLILKENSGLLISDVSSRVIEKARRNAKYKKDIASVSGTSGSLNIELLISLLENSKVHDWEWKTQFLKGLVQKDIESILSRAVKQRFYLHKALLELHKHSVAKTKETLIGLISLNYDTVLDLAYRAHFGPPDYCFSLERQTPPLNKTQIPLLKLHGSFNWKNQKIRGRKRTIEIIPLGSNKSYLHPPYGFIWNRALDILTHCDTLRVIGCSLSQNDFHLIDLLFKAHLERNTAFEIEIINFAGPGEQVLKNYGFFSEIKTLSTEKEVKGPLIEDPNPANPFKAWVKYNSIRMLGKHVTGTRYLKKVLSGRDQ